MVGLMGGEAKLLAFNSRTKLKVMPVGGNVINGSPNRSNGSGQSSRGTQ